MGTSLYEQYQRDHAQPNGLVTSGNIDLAHRPRVRNPDGSISTVRSMSFGEDGHEVLVPTVSDDGRIMSDDEAVAQYHKTGKHLGIFSDPQSANRYAQQLHEQQAAMIGAPSGDHDGSLYEQFRAQQGQPSESPTTRAAHDQFKRGTLGKRMAAENANDAATVPAPSYGQEALGGIASLAKDIPGAEATQAALRSIVRGQSYRDARSDIQSAEDAAPTAVRRLNRVVGGAVSAGAIPGSPALAGARYGILSGLGESNPDVGVKDRLHDAAKQGAIGAIAGKATDAAVTGARALLAKPLGETAQGIDQSVTDATRANYGKAAAEGAANGGTSPGLQQALEHPRVKPFVDMVREDAPSMSDADAARSVYKLMSKQRRGLQSFMDRNGYDAVKDLEIEKLGSAMKQLKSATASVSIKPSLSLDVAPELHEVDPRITPGRETLDGPVSTKNLSEYTTPPSNPSLRQALRDFPASALPPTAQGPGGPSFQLRGQPEIVKPGVSIETPGMRIKTAPAEVAPPVMPSFPKAVATKARMEGERGAFERGADATRRILSGKPVMGKKLLSQSPEAFSKAISEMSPDEAQAALRGVLGRTKGAMGVNANPLKLFGAGSSAADAATISPFVGQLDAVANRGTIQHGLSLPALLRSLGITSAASATP